MLHIMILSISLILHATNMGGDELERTKQYCVLIESSPSFEFCRIQTYVQACLICLSNSSSNEILASDYELSIELFDFEFQP